MRTPCIAATLSVLWLSATCSVLARTTKAPRPVHIAVVGVERLSYGLPCLSHQCHEYFLVALQEPAFGFESGHLVLVSYPFKPGGPQPARAQLDATRYWTFALKRLKTCDATWDHFLSRNQLQALNSTTPLTIAPDLLLPCFTMAPGEFSVNQE